MNDLKNFVLESSITGRISPDDEKIKEIPRGKVRIAGIVAVDMDFLAVETRGIKEE